MTRRGCGRRWSAPRSRPCRPIATSPERGWAKIAAFSPTLAPLLAGPVLYLDLDLVIVGALDPLFEQPGRFLIIRDWYHPMGGIGNSSVFRYDLAAGLLGLFADPGRHYVSTIVRRHRNEQEYRHALDARHAGVLASGRRPGAAASDATVSRPGRSGSGARRPRPRAAGCWCSTATPSRRKRSPGAGRCGGVLAAGCKLARRRGGLSARSSASAPASPRGGASGSVFL